ncbi:MAG: hypothetical protein WBN44_11325 [Woeseiaceae bacterium]
MHSLFSTRLIRMFTIIIPLTILMGCGEGDGQQRILGTPAPPFVPPPASCDVGITFEDLCPAVTFTDFEGGVSLIVDNPDQGAGNPSDKVVRMQKFEATSGELFGGTTVGFPTPFTVAAGSSFTVKVWSQRAVQVLFQPEPQGPGTGVEVTHGGTGWEELTFSLPALSGEVSGATFIFDNGTLGAAATDPDNWTFYYDYIILVAGGGGGGGTASFPITFDEATPPAVSEFGGAGFAIEAGPAGGDGNALKIVRDGGDVFAGVFVTVPSIPNDAGDQTISALVYSPTAGIPIVTKAEFDENMGSGDVQANETVVVGWQTLTWTFTNLAAPNDYTRFVILPNLGTVDTATEYFFDNIDLVAGGGGGGSTLGPIDFEPGGQGAAFTWNVFENGDNPAVEFIANPDASGANTSATVAQFTARQAGQPFAGTVTADLPTFTLDASNSTVTIMVWKSVISDVGIKFENATGGSTGEIKVANTVTDQWEELTFDFSGVIGDPNNTDITGFVIFPDFDARTQDNVIYFDNITFSDGSGGGTGGGGGSAAVDFETAGTGAGFTWNVFENADNPPLEIIANPDATGANTSATVAQFTARVGGQPFAGTVTSDLPTFTLDASNSTVTIMVWKSVISDVGIKFENATGGSTGEIKVANTVTDQWEELTFDFSGVIGDPNNTDITGLVIFPDFDARTQDNVIYFDNIAFSDSGGGGGASGSIDFESGAATFNDFDGGVATVIANPDASGINTSAQVGQMQKFAGQPFGGSTLDLGGAVPLAAGDSYTMKVRSSRSVVVTLKLEPLNEERTATHSGSGTWEELCFDFTGVSGDVTGITLIFDNGTPGDAANDPDNWTFQFDDIAQTSNACPTGGGGGPSLGPIDFEPSGLGEAFAWTVFENGDNPPLTVIDNPDQTGANTSGRVAQFTARVAGQPFAGTITSDLPTFTLDASNAIVKIKVWKSVISDVGIKFETATGGSTGEIKVANTVTDQWEELTFDFSGVIGDPNNTDIAGLVIFPDFDARTQDNIVYFDDVTFEAVPTGGGGTGSFVNGDFETGDFTGWTLTQDPPGRGSINVDSSGQGGRAGTVARLVAAGDATGTNDVVIGQVALGAGTIQPGDSIDVSFDLYGALSGAGGVVFVEVIFLNAAGQDEGGRNFVGPAAPYTPTTTWTPYSGTVIAGVGANASGWDVSGGVTLELKAACGAIAGGCGVDASFDNVTFTIN